MPRRNRSLPYLVTTGIVVVVAVAVWLRWPPWTLMLGGVSLAVGVVAWQATHPGSARCVTVGRVPVLTPAFQQRTGVQALILDARAGAHDVVLHGPGGTGTTQLAAAAAHEARRSGADLVVWVDAGAPASVVTAFALAAAQVGAPGVTGTDVSADARALVGWLAETDRRWLVVFDGVTDAALLDRWWPADHPGTGWIIATTTGPVAHPVFERARAVEVPTFTAAESHEYLTDCDLADDDAAELATELGHLPLALSRAARYLRAERVGCRDYLTRWIDRRKTVADPADAAVRLAVEAAQRHGPAREVLPVLHLAAVLDPAGQPAAVWTDRTAAGFLAGTGSGSRGVVARAVTTLHRYGLVEFDRRLGHWMVRMHPGHAHAVRKNAPADVRDDAALAAADAVLEAWPAADAFPEQAELVQVLRANAHVLTRLDGDPLWRPEPHELLWRAGSSLQGAGLHAPAIAHWQYLVDTGVRRNGPLHAGTLTAIGHLAATQGAAGRTADAVASYERLIEGLKAVHGPGHAQVRDAERLAEQARNGNTGGAPE